jgi:hypothetical protein
MKIKVINSSKTTTQRIQAAAECPFVIDVPPLSKQK